jgi:hypothetical protein
LSAGLTGKKVLAPMLGAIAVVLLVAAAPGAAAGTARPPDQGRTGHHLRLSLKAKLEGDAVAVEVTGTDKASVMVSYSLHGRRLAAPKRTTVEPGRIGRASLPISAALKRQLAKTSRNQKLAIVIEATGHTAAGVSVDVSAELALPGRKKSARHAHRHAA